MVASYGDAGRASYRAFELTGDIIHPIVYTLFFALFITWLLQRGLPPGSKMQKLNVVPFGGWLFAGATIICILIGLVMALKNGFKKQG